MLWCTGIEMARRRGHLKRSGGYYSPKALSDIAADFETQTPQLGPAPENYASSVQLRLWCGQNRNRCYITEWCLNGGVSQSIGSAAKGITNTAR